MPGVEVSWWAVLATTVFNVAVGSLWFGVIRNSSKRPAAKKSSRLADADITIWFVFICSIVQAWVLVHFVRYAGALTFWRGAVTGFWLWLSLIAITALMRHLFESPGQRFKPAGTIYFMIIIVVDCGLQAAWR